MEYGSKLRIQCQLHVEYAFKCWLISLYEFPVQIYVFFPSSHQPKDNNNTHET
jgi:hypothetical protein